MVVLQGGLFLMSEVPLHYVRERAARAVARYSSRMPRSFVVQAAAIAVVACHPHHVLVQHVKRFRGGLVFKAHRLLYHSTLGLRVIKKKKKRSSFVVQAPAIAVVACHQGTSHIGFL